MACGLEGVLRCHVKPGKPRSGAPEPLLGTGEGGLWSSPDLWCSPLQEPELGREQDSRQLLVALWPNLNTQRDEAEGGTLISALRLTQWWPKGRAFPNYETGDANYGRC